MPGILTPSWQKPPRGAVLNRSHPWARNIRGLWLFNEAAGGLVNNLAAPPAQAISGTLGSQWVATSRGGTLSFNGSNNYINTGRVLVPAVAALTVAFWVNTTVSTSTRILSNETIGSGAVSGSFGLGLTGFHPLLTVFGVNDYQDTSGIVTNGGWSHVALTLAGTTLKSYINGRLTATLTITAPTFNSSPWLIGRRGNTSGTEYFPGYLDALIILDRVLSATEVASLYAAPYQMIAPAIPDEVFYSIGVGGGRFALTVTRASAASTAAGSLTIGKIAAVATQAIATSIVTGTLTGKKALSVTGAAATSATAGTLSTAKVAAIVTLASAASAATGSLTDKVTLAVTTASGVSSAGGTLSLGTVGVSLTAASAISATTGTLSGKVVAVLSSASAASASAGNLGVGTAALTITEATSVSNATGSVTSAITLVVTRATAVSGTSGELSSGKTSLVVSGAGGVSAAAGSLQTAAVALSVSLANSVSAATGFLGALRIPLAPHTLFTRVDGPSLAITLLPEPSAAIALLTEEP